MFTPYRQGHNNASPGRVGAPYATYKSGSRIRTCAVNSSDYRNFIRHSAWKQGETRNKTIYAMRSDFSKDQINAAAIALGVHEELRPEGKFWSLPKGEGAGAGA